MPYAFVEHVATTHVRGRFTHVIGDHRRQEWTYTPVWMPDAPELDWGVAPSALIQGF